MSRHTQRSQQRLHEIFFRGFADLESAHIEKACMAILKDARKPSDEPLKILDLGCGTVPYAQAFENIANKIRSDNSSRNIELVLVDKDKEVLGSKEIPGCTAEWIELDILNLDKLAQDEGANSKLAGPFDLVILAASLHEFYYGAVSQRCERWDPATFHESFLRYICVGDEQSGGLVEPRYGSLIIADYAWAPQANPKHLQQIVEYQTQYALHADPPWAFVSPERVFNSLYLSNFRLESTIVVGLYDQLNDDEIQRELPGLTPEERETLRLRHGFVLTFQPGNVPEKYSKPPTNIQVTTLYVSHAVEQLFKKSANLNEEYLRNGLNSILTSTESTHTNSSPLVNLATHIYRDSEQALRPYHASDPGDCEIWIGIGLRKFKSRFVPELPRWWQPNGRTIAGGVLLKPSDDVADERLEGLAGPVSIIYDKLLGASSSSLRDLDVSGSPSIHNWCVQLHRAIREAAREPSNSLTSPLFRSLTILSPDATAHDHAISAAWGDERQQSSSGHYFLRICPEELNAEIPTNLSNVVRIKLDQISIEVATAKVSWLPKTGEETEHVRAVTHWLYTAFLTSVFGLGDEQQINKTTEELRRLQNMADTALEGHLHQLFDALIDDLKNYSEAIATCLDFPQYNCYTTLAFGCDGLSPSDPDTLMIFSEHPIPPSALDEIGRYCSDLFRRIVQAESDTLIERQAQTQADLDATKRLIRAFGHDGKTPASLIERVLREEDFPIEQRVAVSGMLATRLTERLGGYRWLISEEKDREKIRERLWDQATEFQNTVWKRVEEIWTDAIAMTILTACVTADDQWMKIRRRLDITSLEKRRQIISSLSNSSEMIKLVRNFTQSYNTHGLRTPISLYRDTAGETTTGSPAVYHALRLIFSEILTNAFRHELPYADTSKDVLLQLDSSINQAIDRSHSRDNYKPVLADISVTISPAKNPANDVIFKSYNGLLSMKDASSAMGSVIETKKVQVATQGASKHTLVKLPFFERINGSIKWTLKEVPLFQ